MRKFLYVLASLTLTLACSEERSESAEMGQVRIPLQASALNRTFQLQNGNFQIVGETTQNINPPADAASVRVNLNPGTYSVALLGGWQLQEVTDGTPRQLDATLVSQNPQPFAVELQETTDIQFNFDTTGTVIPFGLGAVSVSVNVITDETLCPTVYVDADGDRYGDPATGQQLCNAGAGYVDNNGDCDDANVNAYPGQLAYFATARSNGSFDYNCDGANTQQPDQIGPTNCVDLTVTCSLNADNACAPTCSSSCGSDCFVIGLAACGEMISRGGAACAPAGIAGGDPCRKVAYGGSTGIPQACN